MILVYKDRQSNGSSECLETDPQLYNLLIYGKAGTAGQWGKISFLIHGAGSIWMALGEKLNLDPNLT